jgi:hypothetical protein
MKYNCFYIVCSCISVTLLMGCKKPYSTPVIDALNSYLVVEGVINSGQDSTIIKLNHTVKLSGTVNVNPELNATVTIEGDDNTTYVLTGTANGEYVSAGLNLNNANKYRLRIKTADNEYRSDFVPVLNTPDIGGVTYAVESDGVGIQLSTHDPQNKNKYYRWEYDETWVFTSAYQSIFKSNGDTVLNRDLVNDQIYTCWRTEHSSTIVLGSAARLSQAVINNSRIAFLSRHSVKIRHKYSILVRQYALTEDAYNFWQNLKKNTEQLGSIFDAQPSQINGNIHSITNPQEPVIGYVSVGTYTTKRAFVDQRNLPAWLDPIVPDGSCKAKAYLYKYTDPNGSGIINQVDKYLNYNKTLIDVDIPIDGIYMRGNPYPIGYSGAPPECVDCTLRGTNKQPDYWQ